MCILCSAEHNIKPGSPVFQETGHLNLSLEKCALMMHVNFAYPVVIVQHGGEGGWVLCNHLALASSLINFNSQAHSY